MKTVLLCPELFGREGGIQRILRLYLKAIAEFASAADEVRLVVLNDVSFPVGVLERYASAEILRRRACAGRKPAFVLHALRHCATADRVVCGHIALLPVAWAARCLRPRLQYFLVAHGIEVWRPYRWIERAALRRARRVLCVSEYTRAEMLRHCGLPPERLVVVPNALDPDLEASTPPIPPPPPNQRVLTVARLDPAEAYKGVDHLIQALPRVRHAVPAARLEVIGTGGDLPRLRDLARQTGVADAVDFRGLVDLGTLRRAYRDCTVFALPSRNEGFGIVFLEAMAHGKPCIGARAGGIPEVVDGACGALVEYGAVPQLAERLVWALQRSWDPEQIRAHAAQFGFAAFKRRLQEALQPSP